MSETLFCTDVVQRVGHTVINGVKVVRHVCVIPMTNPEGMSVTMTKLNGEMYKEYRRVCRDDFNEFEDAAFQLQEKYIAKRDAECCISDE